MEIEKTVVGKARKSEDVKKFYEIASERVDSRCRVTDRGKVFITAINEILDNMELESVPFQKVVEYILVAEDKSEDERDKIDKSLRAFFKTNAGKTMFETYREDTYSMIRKKRIV